MYRAAAVAASRVVKLSPTWRPCSSHADRLASHSLRSFHTSRPSWAAPPPTSLPTSRSILVVSPSHDQITEQGYDEVDIVPPQDVKIQITDRAAEVRIIRLSIPFPRRHRSGCSDDSPLSNCNRFLQESRILMQRFALSSSREDVTDINTSLS
jgi:hypothetical protein